jgi:hypothetical protein
MFKNKKDHDNVFFYNNKMIYIKIDLFYLFFPSYDQFIMQYQLLTLN